MNHFEVSDSDFDGDVRTREGISVDSGRKSEDEGFYYGQPKKSSRKKSQAQRRWICCLIATMTVVIFMAFSQMRRNKLRAEIAAERAYRAEHGLTSLNQQPEFKSLYLFEVARHGARAPISHDAALVEGFKQLRGMLTSQGMRQRRLLGKYNVHKYPEVFESKPRHTVHTASVTSTDLYRTIQSAYSELSGVTEALSSSYTFPFMKDLTTREEAALKKNLPFKARRSSYLEVKKAPKGFVPIPVYTLIAPPDSALDKISPALTDDPKFERSCFNNPALASTLANSSSPPGFLGLAPEPTTGFCYLDLIDKLSSVMAQRFNLTGAEIPTTYLRLNELADTIFCRAFESLEDISRYSQEELHDIYEVNKWDQIMRFDQATRRSWMKTMLEEPLARIEAIAEALIAEKDKKAGHSGLELARAFEDRFLLYSAHDTQVGNIWYFLDPHEFEWYYIPFSSYVQLSLSVDEVCFRRSSEKGGRGRNGSKDNHRGGRDSNSGQSRNQDQSARSCFFLHLTSNGQPLAFILPGNKLSQSTLPLDAGLKMLRDKFEGR